MTIAPESPSQIELPNIVSVDDHVVEPPHLFETWLPAKFKSHPDVPRVERRGLAGMKYLGGTKYDFDWQDDAPKADCWLYEDLIAPHKRHVAAVGFSRDEMTASPITYDEMRPGCYEPKARVEDMLFDGVDASLCFPTMPRFCGQTFSEANDMDLAPQSLKDRMSSQPRASFGSTAASSILSHRYGCPR